MIEGSLGCPNCRDRFPVERGFGDLRPPPRSAGDDAPRMEPPGSPSAMEVAALLGLTEGSGNVALIGDLAGHAPALAKLVGGVEFVGIAPGLRGREEEEGVSRMAAGASLPFSDGSLRGVGFIAGGGVAAVGGPPAAERRHVSAGPSVAGGAARAGQLPMTHRRPTAGVSAVARELARVVARGARIAAWGPVEGWETALRSEGLEVLASEDAALVVGRAS